MKKRKKEIIERIENLEEKIKILEDSRKSGVEMEKDNRKEKEKMENKIKEIKRRI